MYKKLPDGTFESSETKKLTKEHILQLIDNEQKDIENWQKNIDDAKARKSELENLIK